VGNLVRVEGPLTDQPSPMDPGRRVPIASAKRPSQIDPGIGRVVARNVLLPSVTAPGIGQTGTAGGFKVTGLLPGEIVGPPIGGSIHEEPLRIDLAVYELSSRTAKASVLTTTLQVMPRN
jgi:hypothetical protein